MLHTWKPHGTWKRLVGKGTTFYKAPLLLAFQPSFFRCVVVFRESVDSIIFRHFMFFCQKFQDFLAWLHSDSSVLLGRIWNPKNSREVSQGSEVTTWWFLLADPIPWVSSPSNQHLRSYFWNFFQALNKQIQDDQVCFLDYPHQRIKV